MEGTKLLEEFARRIMQRKGTKSVTDAALARELGVTPAALVGYRERELTPRQVVNLMEKFSRRSTQQLMDETVIPVVEFYKLEPTPTKQGANQQIFPVIDSSAAAHPYTSGLKDRLDSTHGIYVFHDSRGRAIYAGKAQKLSLWVEINNAFNRDRKEVQSIKRVNHPTNRVEYKLPGERKRQITKETVALHDIAAYVSAYAVPEGLIGKFEALIVRAFANDLLNVRMENF